MVFAIDDIKVTRGLCSHETDYVYNFEKGYEDLDVEEIVPAMIDIASIHSPYYSPDKIFPKFDHTLGTSAGHYYLFDPSTSLKHNFYEMSLSIFDLKSDTRDKKCVRFAYQRTENVTFAAYVLADYESNYDYQHNHYSRVWYSEL